MAWVEEFGTLSLERLEAEIGELAAHIQAATCRWLLMVAELDRREGWAGWGCRSCAEWLSLRCGLALGPGREHVRVAHRLTELPLVRAEFGAGRLSYSKVRAITRVATPDSEDELVELALHATAAQLERIVRAYRTAASGDLESANRASEERSLSWMWDDDGSLIVRGRLPAEEGALFLNALQCARREIAEETRSVPAETPVEAEDLRAETPISPGKGGDVPAETPISPGKGRGVPAETPVEAQVDPGQANADALALMAERSLTTTAAPRLGAERREVVLHVDAGALAGANDHPAGEHGSPPPRCELQQGPALPAQTARRLACDASLVVIAERHGQPLDVGRRTRTISPALGRALRSRDQGCRFPGCDRHRHVDAHHIHHWAQGGETNLSNLVLLCSHHHRLLHEGGYQVERRSDGRLIFTRPDGRKIAVTPPRTRGGHHAIRRQHHHQGLKLAAETPAALSAGSHFDLGMAVEAVLQTDDHPATARAG